MLKWYLRIYIFIEYLKCVWKSNCIWIIRNDSKKKEKKRRRVRIVSPGSGSASRSGRVRWRGPSHWEVDQGKIINFCIILQHSSAISLKSELVKDAK